MIFPRHKCHFHFEADDSKLAKLYIFGGERANSYSNENYEVLGFDENYTKVLGYFKDFRFTVNSGFYPHNGYLYFYSTLDKNPQRQSSNF
jgi:hypothetical protein